MYRNGIKRILAILLSLCGMVCLSWLFLILSIAIKLDSPGPIFFRQKRVGIRKKHFEILKFRTMRIDTPHDMPTHMLKDPDQYITRVGRFLRKTSLDELPQLWNIFMGDMAVIGPRPALWNQYDLLAERDKYGANDVCPGLTGWAQIHGRDELEIEVKARLDGEYVQNMSFWLDVRCFFGTILAVLRHDGVVEGGTGALPRKKVLVVTNHSYMLWQFRRELIQALMQDHEVVLSMPFVGHEEKFQAMGLRCIRTDIDRRGENPFREFQLLMSYARQICQEKPDLVITYSVKPNIYAGLVCRLRGVPYCVNVQGLGTAFEKERLARLVSALYRIALRKVRTVFFENYANAQVFIDRGIVPADKIVVLPGAGINLERFEASPYPKNDCFRFLYMGRIMQEKGIDELFACAQRLRAEGERFVLDVVGFFEDEYREWVEQLERKGIVRFHGFQKEVCSYYMQADCVVLPSYHEGMSNVLLEAAAVGRPIVTSDIPGCREAVENGRSGLLVPAKNDEALYHAMKQMLNMPWERRAAMGEAGRQKMEREFDKKAVVEMTLRALNMSTRPTATV